MNKGWYPSKSSITGIVENSILISKCILIMCTHIEFVKVLLFVVSSRSGVHHSPLHKNDLQVIVEELNYVKQEI